MRITAVADDVNMNTDHGGSSLLLPSNSTLTAFSGFLTSKSGRSYRVQLTLPRHSTGDHLHEARLEVGWRLEYILRGHVAIVRKHLRESENVTVFLRHLKTLVDQFEVDDGCSSTPLPRSYYHYIIDDLASVGWSSVMGTSSGLTALKLAAIDEQGRTHTLSLDISPSQYPRRAPRVMAETPLPFSPKWSPTGRLANLMTQFKDWIGQFQTFWSVMDDIDSNLWVIEPLLPTRDSNRRKVMIDSFKSLSVYLEIDCLRSTEPPQCHFLGPDNDVNPMKEAFATRRHHWNPNSSVVENLKKILGVDLPSKPPPTQEQISIECPICYQGSEGGDVPDICCDNCSKYYHKTCIVEWFKGLPTSIYTTFQSLSGECPYCNKRMAVKP